MGLNDTPKGERLHIALFGRRNAGKSSIINAITGQNLSIVSNVLGTTTDPVYKAMELLPLGPVMLIDTPGLDDDSELGEKRVQKTWEVLDKANIALIIIDTQMIIDTLLAGRSVNRALAFEKDILKKIKSKDIPSIVVFNKWDYWNIFLIQHPELAKKAAPVIELSDINVSVEDQFHIEELKELIASKAPRDDDTLRIVGDLISPSDFIVLVVPIDKAAPKGRLILPQQQTIRDILESDATAIVVKEYELRDTLASLGKKPKMVITDSQVFAKVAADTPKDIWLTSFSILFARYKGNLETLAMGALAVDSLEDGDKILMAEGCTHHRQCDDIGTVKIPRWLMQYTGKKLQFETASGNEFPDDLSPYKLIIHCGGCMLNKKEMDSRIRKADLKNLPIVNYGVLIAYMQGILKRCVEPFPSIYQLFD